MAKLTFKGNPANTAGNLPAVGSAAPDFTLVGADLAEITKASLAGKKVILNIFPSIDTGVCATSVRTFHKRVGGKDGVVVLCVSQDLPFAGKRFCGAEGITGVSVASAFRSDFGKAYGVTLTDTPLKGLCARAVVVLDGAGKVTHAQLVPEIAQEPDYDAALKAIGCAPGCC